MLVWQFPILVLLLLPIILIEIAVAKRCMAAPLPPRFAGGIVWANLLSTLLGIPLAWFGLVLLEFGAAFVFYKIHGDFSADRNFPQRHKHIYDLIVVFASLRRSLCIFARDYQTAQSLSNDFTLRNGRLCLQDMLRPLFPLGMGGHCIHRQSVSVEWG
ncbi:MAG TPA: hypothetical protein VL992_12465 [Tepidisphaeraceae bacterium]|nr:hypothetical protein [Tepidisphaeraceae bacterium]